VGELNLIQQLTKRCFELDETLTAKDREIAALTAEKDRLLNRVRHFEALERDRVGLPPHDSYWS